MSVHPQTAGDVLNACEQKAELIVHSGFEQGTHGGSTVELRCPASAGTCALV